MANRKDDEYQNVKFYAKHTKAKTAGFSKFEVDKDFYFCRYVEGEIAMLSQAYSSAAGRDNGIESVRKNEKIAKRFRFEPRGSARHGFSLKAGNGQEIAISPDYASRAKAERITAGLTGGARSKPPVKKSVLKTKKAAPQAKKVVSDTTAAFTAADGRIENYKPLAFYEKNGGTSDGFHSFAKNGAYYFHYNQAGKVVLISESYTSKSGRDNGVASVKKNMKLASAYQHHRHKNGKFYFDINAANKQEIATSRWYNSRANANNAARRLRGEVSQTAKPKAAKAAPTAKARKGNVEQNYLPLAAYKKATKGKRKGFESFRGEDGEHYFTYFENGKIALISEGYPTAAVRDKGLASVQKNMKIESRYAYGKGADGKEGFILKAGNHKEIARSVGYASSAAAATGAAYIMGKRKRPKAKTVKKTSPAVKPLATGAVAATGLAAKSAPAKPKPVKAKAAPVKAPSKPTPSPEKTPKPIAPLAAGTVAGLGAAAAQAKPSAPDKKAVPDDAPKIKTAPVAAPAKVAGSVAVGAAAVAAASAPPPPPKAPPVAAAAPVTAAPVVAAAPAAAAAASAGGGGIWGWLKWVLMALLALLAILFLFKACAGGEKAAKPVPAQTPNTSASAAAVTCWNGSKARTEAACPSKISCWDDSFATELSACPARPVAKEFTCWDGSLAVDATSCPVEPVAAAPVAKPVEKMTAPSVAGRLCGTSPQTLFNVTSSSPKSVSYLGSNPQFGNSLSLTPDGFYRKLSAAYQVGGGDRAFLNLMARSLGYGSFRDMDASMFSNDTLPLGSSGLLGFGSNHALQFSTLNLTDAQHLEAFKVRSANGTDVHFMKRCGNFMYVCQP